MICRRCPVLPMIVFCSLAFGQQPPDVNEGENSTPSLISKVEPRYTDKARKDKLSGSVLLSIVVDGTGVPKDIRVLRPLGDGDEKAIEAVSQWRFKPAMRNGQAAALKAKVEVSFRLCTDNCGAGPDPDFSGFTALTSKCVWPASRYRLGAARPYRRRLRDR